MIAIVTGANQGLGLGTAQALAKMDYEVILGIRNPAEGAKTEKLIQSGGGKATYIPLDVSDEASIEKFYKTVVEKFKTIDVLVNNAGVYLDSWNTDTTSSFKTPSEVIKKTFITNTLGPFLLIQKFLPLMLKQNYGRIVNISSGMGQLSEMEGGSAAYRISKTALNSVTKLFSTETEGKDVLINAVCPGWVKTRMGTSAAERNLEEGVKGIVWASTIEKGGPNGGFFRDGERLDW